MQFGESVILQYLLRYSSAVDLWSLDHTTCGYTILRVGLALSYSRNVHFTPMKPAAMCCGQPLSVTGHKEGRFVREIHA